MATPDTWPEGAPGQVFYPDTLKANFMQQDYLNTETNETSKSPKRSPMRPPSEINPPFRNPFMACRQV